MKGLIGFVCDYYYLSRSLSSSVIRNLRKKVSKKELTHEEVSFLLSSYFSCDVYDLLGLPFVLYVYPDTSVSIDTYNSENNNLLSCEAFIDKYSNITLTENIEYGGIILKDKSINAVNSITDTNESIKDLLLTFDLYSYANSSISFSASSESQLINYEYECSLYNNINISIEKEYSLIKQRGG